VLRAIGTHSHKNEVTEWNVSIADGAAWHSLALMGKLIPTLDIANI